MPATPEKLDLASLDVAADKRRLLHQLFPEAFTESTGADGKPAELDFEKLKDVLGAHVELATPGQERYGLEWPGKRDALKAVQAPSLATLIPAPEESVDWETTQNVFIEGDNLEVLKLLQKSYYGKVKMIYIDPPYNTGNDFVYPDNYAESLDTYLRYTGKIDDQGFKTTTNSKDSGRFHSNWLRMMYPRLYVAKNLLQEDGVIFISIDDNEVANLRHLCDQIFGEDNFVANFVWQKRYSRENRGSVGDAHEYIVCYAKSGELFAESSGRIPLNEQQEKIYRNPNNDPAGRWRGVPMTAQGFRPNQMYEVVAPSGKIHTPPEGRCWGFIESEYKKYFNQGRIYFGKDGDAQPQVIRYLSEVEGLVPWTWLPHEDAGHTDESKKEIYSIFNKGFEFDTPKPTRLLRLLTSIAGRRRDFLIIDFFAGSATMSDAAMSMNADDGGSRRCISVQLPEPCSEDSELRKAGFETIADIAKERIRRAGAKIREEHDAKLNAAEKDADLLTPQSSNESSLTTLDTGFRVFKLAPSNFKRWDGEAAAASKEALVQQMEATLDHIATGATEDSLLFEILLKAGYQLTCPLEKLALAGHTVWSVDGGSLFVCVEDRIDSALVDAVAEKHPVQFICLDRALQGDDPLKVNTLETFRSAQPEIQFRTV
jgi:adenine-specific DNA-methyltransferase